MEEANKQFFRWVPGVGTFMSIGNADWAERTGNPRANEYATNAGLSLVGDAAIALTGGVKPLNLATSYIGSKIGKTIGEKYDMPLVGEVAGAIIGGGSPNVAKDIYNIGKTLNNFRKFSKIWNQNVKDPNYLTTQYIEHATPYGRRFGSQYNTYSKQDVGFHASYPNSKVTKAIVANNPDTPMTVKEGYFIYSPATKPVDLGPDKGNWEHTFNKELYEKYPWLYKDITLDDSNMQDAVQIASHTPSGTYKNGFESKGETSIALFDPNIFRLSENEIAKPRESLFFMDPYSPEYETLANNQGKFIKPNKKKEILTSSIPHDISKIMYSNAIPNQIVSDLIKPHIENLKKYYNSGFYARRLAKSKLLSERDNIVNQQLTNLDNIIFRTNFKLGKRTYGQTKFTPRGPMIEFNPGTDTGVSIRHAVNHEGNHAASNIKQIYEHNFSLLKDMRDNINPEIYEKYGEDQVDNYLKYMEEQLGYSLEPGGQLQNALMYMKEKNISADDLLKDKEYIKQNKELKNFIATFKPEYVKKILGPTGLLSLIAINNDNEVF